MTLTLDQADSRAVRWRGTGKGVVGIAVCVAVLDDAGHLKAFSRMDGAWLGSVDVAMSKARTSVLFQAETQAIGEVCKPGAEAAGLERSNGGLVTFAGGIPLLSSEARSSAPSACPAAGWPRTSRSRALRPPRFRPE